VTTHMLSPQPLLKRTLHDETDTTAALIRCALQRRPVCAEEPTRLNARAARAVYCGPAAVCRMLYVACCMLHVDAQANTMLKQLVQSVDDNRLVSK
jgi:hypothetical protein